MGYKVTLMVKVEFYFSDSNLPMDKFLLSKVGGSANHPVDLSMLHSFKRMRHFQPFSAIVEALRTSQTLELADNDTKVRRKVPLPESVNESLDPGVIQSFEDEAMIRSIYAKGFGEEKPSTQFDIEAFFAPHGPTNAIRLRRTYDKIFKGSVFVEFDSEETQQKFLALNPKPKWKGQELLIKSKKDYCDEKIKEIEAGRIQPNRNRGSFRGRGRGDGNANRDWRERRAEDQQRGFEKGGRGHRGRRGRGNGRAVQKDARYVLSNRYSLIRIRLFPWFLMILNHPH
jgi:lupus La protein